MKQKWLTLIVVFACQAGGQAQGLVEELEPACGEFESGSIWQELLESATTTRIGVHVDTEAEAPDADHDFRNDSRTLAPYVPSPLAIVECMLEMAQIGPEDVVYDLGSGDGRIVNMAALKFKVRAVGIDFNPERIREAKANAEALGVQDLVHFIQGDIMEVDVSEASVVTIYLLGASNLKLRSKLTEELQVGARIVSHAFDMGDDWEPEKTVAHTWRRVHLWRTDGIVRP